MPKVIRCVSLLLALSGPASALSPANGPLWVLGNFQRHISARVVQDEGLSVLVQEQRVGSIPVVFQKQHDAPAGSLPAADVPNGSLIRVRGRFVTEELSTVVYSGPPGVMPTSMSQEKRTFTYFLALDDYLICSEPDVRLQEGGKALEIGLDGPCLPETAQPVKVLLGTDNRQAKEATLEKGKRLLVELGGEDPTWSRLWIGSAALKIGEAPQLEEVRSATGLISIERDPALRR